MIVDWLKLQIVVTCTAMAIESVVYTYNFMVMGAWENRHSNGYGLGQP